MEMKLYKTFSQEVEVAAALMKETGALSTPIQKGMVMVFSGSDTEQEKIKSGATPVSSVVTPSGKVTIFAS